MGENKNNPWDSVKVDNTTRVKEKAVIEFNLLSAIPEVPIISGEEFTNNVEVWTKSKGLHKVHPYGQVLKFGEEGGELFSAVAKGQLDQVLDAIGDVDVVIEVLLLQIKEQLILSGNESLVPYVNRDYARSVAWDEIKDRKGLVVDGIFIKWDDLSLNQKAEVLKKEETLRKESSEDVNS